MKKNMNFERGIKEKEDGEFSLDAILAIEVDAYAYANLQLEKLLVPLENLIMKS